MRRILFTVALAAVMSYPISARAGSSGTSDEACGSASAGWDAPNGALVMSRHEGGVITPVIDTLGEYRTHSMISHGPGYYVTHSTMYSPGTTGWPTYCSTPAKPDELREGYPGISQVNDGAIYENQHGYMYLRYQLASSGTNLTRAQNTANWLWSYSDYKWVTSKQDSGQGMWRVGIKSSSGTWYEQPYVLYQYKDLQNRNFGWQWTPVYNGAVCSTTLAWAFYKALAYYGDDTSAYISAYTYDHATIVNAGNALYNGVKDACDDGLGFWGGLGASITCFESICDDAGRQVRNCMANAGCCDTDDNSCGWNPLANDSSATATSVSPDRLGGWSGHPYTGPNVGPWAPYGTSAVNWNSGGSVYGCWF